MQGIRTHHTRTPPDESLVRLAIYPSGTPPPHPEPSPLHLANIKLGQGLSVAALTGRVAAGLLSRTTSIHARRVTPVYLTTPCTGGRIIHRSAGPWAVMGMESG